MSNKVINKIIFNVLPVLNAILLSFFIISEHLRTVPWLNFEENGRQFLRITRILSGTAQNPWQYRPLAPVILSPLLALVKELGFSDYIAVSLLSFRFILDVSALLLCFSYYRKSGLSFYHSLIGINILGWGMSYAYYNSDLSFNTSLDLIFYLLAGISILNRKINWVIPITFFAALNRETSGLIPFLFFFSFHDFKMKKINLKNDMPVLLSMAIYLTVFIMLRLVFPVSDRGYVDADGHYPGLDMLMYNLLRGITWLQLFATLGILPLFALLGYPKSSLQLKTFFWVIVPAWLIIHMFGGVMAESRCFLVPQAMVFIPGALTLVQREGVET